TAAEQQEALREFVAVTGTEEDRACFFESATWDLQIALASFYDTEKEDIITISQATSRSVSRGTAPSDNRVTSFRDFTHDQDEDEEEEEGQRFHLFHLNRRIRDYHKHPNSACRRCEAGAEI
uniref:NSFL1 cofactor p47 n=1 Tax=Nomascus leucogenys TaxID=61853 RepID=A0A2I3HTC2_NOMLE